MNIGVREKKSMNEGLRNNSQKGLLYFSLSVALIISMAFVFENAPALFIPSSKNKIEAELNLFLQKTTPTLEINFSELYGRNGQFQVLHPLLDMLRWRLPGPNPSCQNEMEIRRAETTLTISDSHANRECSSKVFEASEKDQWKNEMLSDFLNGKRGSLPVHFLTKAPFVNRWGSSYAYLLNQSGLLPFNTKAWVEANLSFFKLSELSEIISKYDIQQKEYFLISHLADEEVEEIVRASPLVMTASYLLVKNQSSFGFSPLSYWVFDMKEVKAHFKKSQFEITTLNQDSACLESLGNICLSYNSQHAMAYVTRYSWAFLIVVGASLLVILSLYLKYRYEKKKEQQKHRLALQVLSHEFRTPVSAMLLMMEQLTKHQSQLGIEEQDLITRISAEIYRLQRIIEMSKNYLQTDGPKVRYHFQRVDSVNQWLLDFTEEFDKKIECELLKEDRSAMIDSYWLKLVLSNLIQNAFVHGKPPVYIRLHHTKDKLQIAVEDQGECEFNGLAEMTNAFIKTNSSKGMGLGLNIIKLVIEGLNSELQFSKAPTSFKLILKNTMES